MEKQAADKQLIRNAIAEQRNIEKARLQAKRVLQRKRQQERRLHQREQSEEKYVRELASLAKATVDKAMSYSDINEPREPFIMNKLRQQSMGVLTSRCEAGQRRWFS